jgi:hypothetical protein
MLAGAPYFIPPHDVFKLTLPQMLFLWAKKAEYDAGLVRDHILGTAIAIGGSLSKEGGAHLQRIIASLEGPPATEDDLWDVLDETQRLVLFGSAQIDASARNPDQDKSQLSEEGTG